MDHFSPRTGRRYENRNNKVSIRIHAQLKSVVSVGSSIRPECLNTADDNQGVA